MGRQIIRQPDGKYAVWSSIVDHFILYDATPGDLIAEFLADEHERVEREVYRVVNELNSGGKPYHQFTMTFDEAMALARAHHGDEDESLIKMCTDLNYTLPPPAFTDDDIDE